MRSNDEGLGWTRVDDYFVHPTAVVDAGARIGDGTKVWHFAHVMGGASVGRDVTIGQNVFVARGTQIGDGCKVQNNVSVYEGVVLDNLVFCGPSMVFTNVRNPRAAHPTSREAYAITRVKRGATIGANATIVRCDHRRMGVHRIRRRRDQGHPTLRDGGGRSGHAYRVGV